MGTPRKLLAAAALATAVLGGAALGGCSNTVSKEDFKTQMKEENSKSGSILSDKNIDCIVDAMEKKGFKFRKYGELTSDEERMMGDATGECLLSGTGLTVPTTGAP